jgi:hypothetical protein
VTSSCGSMLAGLRNSIASWNEDCATTFRAIKGGANVACGSASFGEVLENPSGTMPET